MTIAEEIENEIDIDKKIPELRQDVINHLKDGCTWRAICDSHVGLSVTHSGHVDTIPGAWFNLVCRWASKEGLHAEAHYNGYGVRSIVINP